MPSQQPNKQQSRLKAAIISVTPLQQNCTLLWNDDSKHGAVCDPGGDLELIERAIKETGVTVEKILLTHGHIDHAGGAAELRERLGVEIEGPHIADRFLLDTLQDVAAQYGMPDVRNVTPDRWVDEGETIEVAGELFELLHCPGHSPGSIVMVNKAAGLILMGDVLFAGGIGRTDFPYGDADALLGAIDSKLMTLPDDMTFICGHGPVSTIGRERASNPFLTSGTSF